MQRRRRRKGRATVIILLVMGISVALAMLLPLGLAALAAWIQTKRGVTGPMDFDPLIMLGIFLGMALGLTLVVLAIVWSITFWLRYTSPYIDGRCAKCGYDLSGTPSHTRPCPECGQWNEMPGGRPRQLQICDDPNAT